MTKSKAQKVDLAQAQDLLRREAQAVAMLADGLNSSFTQAAEMIFQCKE